MMNETIFRELVEEHLSGELATEGKKRLAAALEQPEYQALLAELLAETFSSGVYDLPETPALQERLTSLLEARTGLQLRPAAKKPVRMVFRWVAAAVLVLAIAGAVFLYLPAGKKPSAPAIARTQPLPPQKVRFKNDVTPGKTGAVLTLANGRSLVLDTMHDGVIVTESGMEIRKLNGQVTYRLSDLFKQKSGNRLVYNNISTASGNQYQLLLSDGTKVYLNANSTIHYPLAFTGKDRTVSVTGEAYFEVALNASQPFRVELPDGTAVNVLGTHFNVQAYHVNKIRTTLVEGAVQLTRNQVQGVLTPGKSGGFDKAGQLQVEDHVNTDKATAWVNHDFYFDNDDITEVMEQISRWYGIEVVYKKNIEERFTGIISRNVGLAQVLAMFENTTNIHFTIEGKTITVLQE
jgi:hypothetical protein